VKPEAEVKAKKQVESKPLEAKEDKKPIAEKPGAKIDPSKKVDAILGTDSEPSISELKRPDSGKTDEKVELDKQAALKSKTTADYLKKKAKEAAEAKKEQPKLKEKADNNQNSQEDKKEPAVETKPENEKKSEQGQQKPPSSSSENKP